MRVKVRHTIDRLADKYEGVAVKTPAALHHIVADNVDYGRDLARALAREKAGPHGQAYWKRITSELTGPLEGEYGPTGEPKTEFVGVGFRSGINTDLPQSADRVGPAMAADVRKLIARLYS